MGLMRLPIVALALLVTVFAAAPDGMAQAAAAPCEKRPFDGASFTVCRFDARSDELRLTGQYRKLADLSKAMGADRDRVRFAMNAGMYDKAGAPIGLYVETGREKHAINQSGGAGNFHMQPNGVFWKDAAGVHVQATDAYVAGRHKPEWATQSGPMLVIGGKLHPSIQDDGPSRYIRNGVGVTDDHTAFFVISDAPVSFGKLARLFRDDLKCADALYLDGAVSSLWLPAEGRMDSTFDLGPLIVVVGRK